MMWAARATFNSAGGHFLRGNALFQALESASGSNEASRAELYELACMAHQVLADWSQDHPDAILRVKNLAHDWLALSASIAGSMLAAVDKPRTDVEASIVLELVTRTRSDCGPTIIEALKYAGPPECFTRDVLQFQDYVSFVQEETAKLSTPGAIVVGIRSSGSFLAPIWHASLASRGIRSKLVTTRPHVEDGAFHAVAGNAPWAQERSSIKDFIVDMNGERVVAIVVDDIAFRGNSFLHVFDNVLDESFDDEFLTFAQNTPLIYGTLEKRARKVLERAKVVTPFRPTHRWPSDVSTCFKSRVERVFLDAEVRSVEEVNPRYEDRLISAASSVPAHVVRNFNPRAVDRHYRVTLREGSIENQYFVKQLGTGRLVEEEFLTLQRFRSVSYPKMHKVGEYLFGQWLPQASHTVAWTPRLLESLNGYLLALARHRSYGSRTRILYADGVRRQIRNVCSSSLLLERVDRVLANFATSSVRPVALVRAPRNQARRHYIPTPDGSVRRVHVDLGEWSITEDMGEEIASLLLELEVPPEPAEDLVLQYAALSGDHDIVHRLQIGALAYTARSLESFTYWESVLSKIPRRWLNSPDRFPHVESRERYEVALKQVPLLDAKDWATIGTLA